MLAANDARGFAYAEDSIRVEIRNGDFSNGRSRPAAFDRASLVAQEKNNLRLWDFSTLPNWKEFVGAGRFGI
jgi:hypothetical protein